MPKPDFWTQSAEAMELTIEGNRLIAQWALDLWHRLGNLLVAALNAEQRHLPPV
jgi:hypothetical protein